MGTRFYIDAGDQGPTPLQMDPYDGRSRDGMVVAVKVRKATAKHVAEAIWTHIVLPYGIPSEILTDRGKNFLSPILNEFLKIARIKKLTTSAFHPRTNGKTERLNGILESYLFKMNTTKDPSRWSEFLDQALLACRLRRESTSKWSP